MGNRHFSCSHTKENITQYLVSPLETGIPDFIKVVTFFQYKAPMIDCVHSVGSDFTEESQQEILAELLSEADMVNRTKFLERIQKNSWDIVDLSGNSICMKCPRMLCKKRKSETEFASLLRHLRNGFAHGRIYVKKTKNQTFIVIDDYDDKNKQSARSVISKAIMTRWYKTINNGSILQRTLNQVNGG